MEEEERQGLGAGVVWRKEANGQVKADADDEANKIISETVSETLRETFSEYVCSSSVCDMFGGENRGSEKEETGIARQHPGKIAEAGSLSSVTLPKTTYPLYESIPREIISNGSLSQLQLESVLYACHQHCRFEGGQRCGFFLGDGTGVGKGRQIAAIILDNVCRGRKRHIWCSTSPDLSLDAKRDMKDIGCYTTVINGCKELDKTQKSKDGVLFVSYSTLVSTGRLDEVIDWARRYGDGFDGCIIFDECHRAKNSESSGTGGGTKVAKAVSDIQKQLPLARVVYCSATGVSEVGHMAYLHRLGLWGPLSAFRDSSAFIESMRLKGLGFLEMLAMELKADGKYVARSLSFHDAEFMELHCSLTPDQIDVYNSCVRFFYTLKLELEIALKKLRAEGKELWRSFWALQQRFFKLICVSMKVPSVIEEADRALRNGMSVVIGLQSTGEAAASRFESQGPQQARFHSTLQSMLLSYIENYFPAKSNNNASTIQNVETYEDAVAEEIASCESSKRRLLTSARSLRLPHNFLDELIDKLGGPNKVAEITGRRTRSVRSGHGLIVHEVRGKGELDDIESLNVGECAAFMTGKKLISIISDAASTGISLHSDRRFQNQRRRLHLTIELPWSADKAIQQLGRTHRSNQVSPPLYKLVVTNIGGEKRFAAAVARRLQSLGALTRGDRRAASAMDLNESNLDTLLGRRALSRMLTSILTDSTAPVDGVSLTDFFSEVEELSKENNEIADIDEIKENLAFQYHVNDSSQQVGSTDQTLRNEERVESEMKKMRVLHLHLLLKKTLSRIGLIQEHSSIPVSADVRKFLNRILCSDVLIQNATFNYFSLSLDSEIRIAKQNGKWSEGVSDLPGRVNLDGDVKTVWKDTVTGAITKQYNLSIDRGMDFTKALNRFQAISSGPMCGFYRSKRPVYGLTLYLFASLKSGSKNTFNICRPNTGESFYTMDAFDLRDRYEKVDPEDARNGWTKLYEDLYHSCMHGKNCSAGKNCTAGRRLTRCSILGGSVVSLWGTLEGKEKKVNFYAWWCISFKKKRQSDVGIVLDRHQYELSKSDRSMRCVQVELENGRRLVGVRYPSHLLPEVISIMESQKEMRGKDGNSFEHENSLLQSMIGSTEQGKDIVGTQNRKLAKWEVKPNPIDEKCKERALKPPVTILSFFKPRSSIQMNGIDEDNSLKSSAIVEENNEIRKNPAIERATVKKPSAPKPFKRPPGNSRVTNKSKLAKGNVNGSKFERHKKNKTIVLDDGDDDVTIVREVSRCPICNQMLPLSFFQDDINKHIDNCLKNMEVL